MPKSCAARQCCNRYSNRRKQLTFHRFPFSRPELLKAWVLNIGRGDFEPKQHTVICSEHFRPECFSAFGNRKNLKHNAVPTVFAFQDAAQLAREDTDPAGEGRNADPEKERVSVHCGHWAWLLGFVLPSSEAARSDSRVPREGRAAASRAAFLLGHPALAAGDKSSSYPVRRVQSWARGGGCCRHPRGRVQDCWWDAQVTAVGGPGVCAVQLSLLPCVPRSSRRRGPGSAARGDSRTRHAEHCSCPPAPGLLSDRACLADGRRPTPRVSLPAARNRPITAMPFWT